MATLAFTLGAVRMRGEPGAGRSFCSDVRRRVDGRGSTSVHGQERHATTNRLRLARHVRWPGIVRRGGLRGA